jgi:hypothetical protein
MAAALPLDDCSSVEAEDVARVSAGGEGRTVTVQQALLA